LQTDGWTDPSSGRFFNVLFVGPLSFKVEALRTNSAEFYIFSFRISCLRELAATIVNEIKAEVQSLDRSLLFKYIGRNISALELQRTLPT
jgi:hypothetical protein